MDKIEGQNQVVINNIENLTKQYNELACEQKKLRTDCSNIQLDLEVVKQRSISTNIVILGVPDDQKNVVVAVANVFKQYRISIAETDYHRIYRLKSINNNSGYTPICVELYSRTFKAAVWLQKQKYGPIVLGASGATEASTSSPLKKIVLKHRMTPYFSDLFKETYKFKESHHYKFAWFQETVILLKKDDSSKPIRIQCAADLQRLA